MLKEIFVDGYKSINQESVELKPFTLFSGVNSAGKSSKPGRGDRFAFSGPGGVAEICRSFERHFPCLPRQQQPADPAFKRNP